MNLRKPVEFRNVLRCGVQLVLKIVRNSVLFSARREYTPQYHTSKAFRNAYKEHLNHTRSQSSTSLSILSDRNWYRLKTKLKT